MHDLKKEGFFFQAHLLNPAVAIWEVDLKFLLDFLQTWIDQTSKGPDSKTLMTKKVNFFCSLNFSWWERDWYPTAKKWACKAWKSVEPLGPWTFAITTNSILKFLQELSIFLSIKPNSGQRLFGNCQAFLLRVTFVIFIFYRHFLHGLDL